MDPEMYPAQVGSPYSTLAVEYTTGADTMTVADATKLPDAPNIVCLSGSVAGEFSYTGKDGNILQGVVALPGTPTTTWSIGAFAFRGIAAYDMNALKARTESAQSQIDLLSLANSPIIGIEWDTASSSPTLTRIDAAGNEFSPTAGFFDNHILFGGRWRCVRNRSTGEITFGTNARGDGLTIDGSAGDVLVRKPAVYCKAATDGDYRQFWISPKPVTGYSIHPWWNSRAGVAQPAMYDGAFESYGYLSGSEFKLGSASGKQPVTGEVSYPDLPNSGRFNIDDAESYAGNVGVGFGCKNFWGYAADQLLMYIEYGTFDIQTALGKGIVDKASGSGFSGENTGANSADTNIGTNGSGVGTGTDGLTPIVWRGMENPYGNVWEFAIGANFYNTDGSYRLVNRDGSGTYAGTLAAGSYESGSGVVPNSTDGYISGFLDGDLEEFAFLPSAAAGSSSTYVCDNWWYPRYNPSLLRAGGAWSYGLSAGPGCRYSYDTPSDSVRSLGARVEFAPGVVA